MPWAAGEFSGAVASGGEGGPLSIASQSQLLSLPNGLTVIVREDRSAPVVSAQAWCRAGSVNEGKWLGAGLSHVLEHMLFKGTETRKVGAIDREVQDLGGHMNAYTSLDRTVYWISSPREGWRKITDILCDIMRNALLPAEELEKESDVIRREMDMGEDDPGTSSSRRLFEAAYRVSPCRYPVIGYREVFDRIGRNDIYAYYREKYAPENVFYVVVGDLNASELLAQITELWNDVSPRPLPPEVLPQEPRQSAPRESIDEAPIELGHFHYAWHIPDIRHEDIPALDVLSTIMGEGHSSRLYRKVRDEQGLTHAIDAWTYSPGYPGLFGISGVADGNRCQEAWRAILEEVDLARSGGFAPEEIEKAKKISVSATLSSRKTMDGQAQDLGSNWMVAHDLTFSQRYLDRIKKITPEEVQQVACRYLTESNRTLAALLPKGDKPSVTVAAEAHRHQDIEPMELDNGARLLVKEDNRLPFVEIRAVFRGGVLAETKETSGLTQLMANSLIKGAGDRDAAALAGAVETVGGHLDSYGSRNSFGISMEVLREDLPLGLEILSDLILRPGFAKAELERERIAQLASIKAQNEHILRIGMRAMRETLFGETGYGLDSLGTVESVEKLDERQICRFFADHGVTENCVIAVYGNVDAGLLQTELDRRLDASQWPRKAGPVFPESIESKPRKLSFRRVVDKKQAAVIVAVPGTTIYTDEHYALELLQEACSDLGSRLFVRIRDRLGLAYYVGARHVPGLVPGYFAFYAGTSPDNARRVTEELKEEIETLSREGLTPEELKRAKAKIVGQKKIARQDLGAIALATALDEVYGFGYQNWEREVARYEAVTLEDIQAVVNALFKPERTVYGLVGPDDGTAASG